VGLVMLAATDEAYISGPPEVVGLSGLPQRIRDWLGALQERLKRRTARR
jgi:hypothetical protein